MPPWAGFVLKPWEARLTPSPPDGCPTTLWLRMKLKCSFVYPGRAERLGIAQTDQLRMAEIDAAKTGNASRRPARWEMG